MSDQVIQTSFHAGEWAPALNARVDLEKYRAAVALGENFFVDYRGGLSTRMGTRYVLAGHILDPDSGKIRLLPFQASADLTFVLEFGNLYIRFIQNGSPVLRTPALTITGITNANPAVVSVVNTASVGETVYISGVGGMTQINDQYYKIIARTAGTITLGDIFTGANIDSSAWGVYTGGGTLSRVYQIDTPYTFDELEMLKVAQNVDKMIICHPDHEARELTLVAADQWILLTIAYGASLSNVPFFTITPLNMGAGAFCYSWAVAPVDENGDEALATFGGTTLIGNMATVQGSVVLAWPNVAGAVSYNVYKATPGNTTIPPGSPHGFIGNVTGTSFMDTNASPDFSICTQVEGNPFGSLNNPTVPDYFQQRLFLGAPVRDPAAFYMTQPGTPYNFDFTRPALPNNGISARIIAKRLNTIRATMNVATGLILFTDIATWLVNAGDGGNAPVTPATLIANEQSASGISNVPPIKAGSDILYVQAKGSIVRNLGYKFESNVWAGTDISVLSSHLFTGKLVLEWAWAEEPFKMVWAVRNDGVMLTLTFLKEQELVGWTHSVTGNTDDEDEGFESVCSVQEGTDFGDVDAVYVVVKRKRNGIVQRYIERFAERIFPFGRESAWCVDSALAYDGVPATTFSNLQHLAGMTVTGVADGEVIPPTVVSATGTITLATAASRVIVGLPFTADFQTLRLDTGAPTIQGKPKKIASELVRVDKTLGIQIGSTFDTLVDMQDLIVDNLNEQDNTVVTDLYTGDARTNLDPNWTTQGQVCIRQDKPYPATILGVIPEFEVTEDLKREDGRG